MSAKPQISSAANIAEGLLSKISSNDIPSPDEFIDLVRQFAETRFDLPDTPDRDGLLFEYLPVILPSSFQISCMRQFIVLLDDDDNIIIEGIGDDESVMRFTQIHFTYNYPIDSSLEDVKGKVGWWWFDEGVPFNEWLRNVRGSPVWRAVADMKASGFTIRQKDFC
jgi:hypothetical protein